ncbi:MAG: DUF748 domain-containing protein [Opitutus sp.]|nr:DUF748 domain-containing protein [Opitutus sp.]MCS6246884.1 DUF748 domain-containing protein [Opitutus sp.]MCS6273602.1 DUF748 domain-containing protein [Opitutus sp.]MCS6277363.1 DUF748 domain-containing protein [Opitutus sp.]MCS6300485.1 DUF748 domain-containing protein [Opitutus sp.]
MSLPKPASAIVSAKKSRLRPRLRRAAIALGVVIGLVLFTFFGLPPIIRAQAVKHLSAALHREVTIERIRLNPFTLSVAVEGLQIKDRDGAPFTAWKRLFVDFDGFSLFGSEWHFEEITLDGFSQRVAIAKDGSFNFADLIPPAAEPVAAAPAAATKPPRPLRISQLNVSAAALAFTDASRARPFATAVGPLSFTLQNFVTAGHPKAPYAFSASTEAGETFAWKGTLSIDPVRSTGEFSVGQLSLKKYAPYYAELINADLLDGVLDVSGRYVFDLTEGARQLALSKGAIKLSRFQLAARGATTPLIDLPSFAIEGLNADGLKPSATIARIALIGGHIAVVRETNGSINLLNLLAASAPLPAATTTTPAAATASIPATPTALPDVKLGELSLSGMAIDIEDRIPSSPAKNGLSRLDISVKNFSLSEAAAPVQVKFSALTVQGGVIDVAGSAVREPLAADLALKITALPLAAATPYIEPMLNLRIAGGTLSVEGNARLNGTVATFKGDVAVDKFATVDGAQGEDFVTFNQFAILGIDATSSPLAAHIREILLDTPSARLVINADKTTNLASILRRETAPASAPDAVPAATQPGVAVSPTAAAPTTPHAAPTTATPAEAGPVWSLAKFTLKNGSVTVADRSIKPSARLSLDHFSGTISGLSSVDLQRADVDIRGQINNTGSVAFTGKLDAKAATLAPGALTELFIDVKHVDLSPISPYVGTYAGYELARSGLTVDVKARLTQRTITSSNVVTLNQFTFGPATQSPEATSLPVRLGVALLKDIDGNIIIDLPIQGSLDDPEFKIGRVVLRVIVNLLMKAATSPFSLIGAAFGGGGDELAYQDFSPGAALPLEAELKKTDTLRKALKGRPALNLDITGSYDATADLAAVREQRLNQQVRFRLWEELRVKNPQTPPPAEIVVSPEDEARIIGLFLTERAATTPQLAATATPATEIPAVKSPVPVKAKAARVVPYDRDQARVRKPSPTPVKTIVLAPSTGAATAPGATAAPTLAEARLALAAAIPVSDDDLRQLAESRAQQVRDALLVGGEIDAGRLFLSPPAPEGKGAKVFLQLR